MGFGRSWVDLRGLGGLLGSQLGFGGSWEDLGGPGGLVGIWGVLEDSSIT